MGNECTSCSVCKNAEVNVDNSKEKTDVHETQKNTKSNPAVSATPNEQAMTGKGHPFIDPQPYSE